jgi:hypothetical protein
MLAVCSSGAAPKGRELLRWLCRNTAGRCSSGAGRLDQRGLVRFDVGNVPPARIRLGADPVAAGLEPAWRDRPSYTRVESLGCYCPADRRPRLRYAIVFRVIVASL